MTAAFADEASLRRLYLDLDAQRADIEATQRAIKNQLRQRLGYGKHDVDDGKITVRPNKRFNNTQAGLVLPGRKLSMITRPVPDAHLAKKVLEPEEYTECQIRVGEATVVIR
jgi:hypothetical protein